MSGYVLDVFCGAGGLTHAMKQAGFKIMCGIDNDEKCRYAFENNNDAIFLRKDVKEITKEYLSDIHWPRPRILIGCAPCQPFSLLKNKTEQDKQWSLFRDFLNIIEVAQPDIISMENVTGFTKFEDGKLIKETINKLEELNYYVWYDIVNAIDYGTPQSRKRMVLLASKREEFRLLPSLKVSKVKTVEDTIKHLAPINSGDTHHQDPLHRSSLLSDINIKRIKQSVPGKNWKVWSDDLVVACQRRNSGSPFSPYGRMEWDKPSPTITTQYYGYSRGRFGHPEQDRALSLREGALLQGFPEDYKFASEENITYSSVGRMVGNAVPFQLGTAIAKSIKHHMMS